MLMTVPETGTRPRSGFFLAADCATSVAPPPPLGLHKVLVPALTHHSGVVLEVCSGLEFVRALLDVLLACSPISFRRRRGTILMIEQRKASYAFHTWSKHYL